MSGDTTDTPTLAERLRNCASVQHSTTNMKALHQVADVLDAFHPRILATAEALAALGPLPAPWTVEMSPVGDLPIRRSGGFPEGMVVAYPDDARYYFAGNSFPTLDAAVHAAIAHLGGQS